MVSVFLAIWIDILGLFLSIKCMKNRITIIVLLCCCVFLLGCPPVIYDSYHYVGANCIRATSWHQATIQLTDGRIIDVTTGYYKSYASAPPNKGLYTKLEIPEKLLTQEEINAINITSSSLGSILNTGEPRVYEGNATYYWSQTITDSMYQLKTTRKNLRSDTITINIANTTLVFTKKPTR